jgi:hypothetical protein
MTPGGGGLPVPPTVLAVGPSTPTQELMGMGEPTPATALAMGDHHDQAMIDDSRRDEDSASIAKVR